MDKFCINGVQVHSFTFWEDANSYIFYDKHDRVIATILDEIEHEPYKDLHDEWEQVAKIFGDPEC